MRLLPSIFLCTCVITIIFTSDNSPLVAAEKPSDESSIKSETAKETDPLLKQVDEAIAVTIRRYLDGKVHTPWQIMHGLLALRHDYQIKVEGKKVSALRWLSNNPKFRGEAWFQKTAHGGRAHPYSFDYAFEGHPNQFLAIMTMSNLPLDHKFKVDDGEITISDMIKHSKAEVNSREEVTWTLWALSHYLGPDARWENKYGEAWNIERLVQMQTRASVYKAACGGTHGMFALSYARNGRIQSGQPLNGVWLEADQKIKRYIQEARSYQNSDGLFSSSYFSGYGNAHDFATRVGTSGHMLEFLMVALPQNRLKEDWVRRGVSALSSELIEKRSEPVECGSLYHALDGLVIYRERMRPRAQIARGQEKNAADAPVEAPRPVDRTQPVVSN